MRPSDHQEDGRRRELTDEVDQHVPLASVVGGVGEQELHQASVHRLLLLGRLHAGVQEVVAALHLQGPTLALTQLKESRFPLACLLLHRWMEVGGVSGPSSLSPQSHSPTSLHHFHCSQCGQAD